VQEGLHKISSSEDTIVALSTPMGRSGIGVIRVSGPLAQPLVGKFFKGSRVPSHRQAIVGAWHDTAGSLIDEVVLTLFEKPQSYTGEDVLEISAHGSPLILQKIISMIQSYGVRLAAPGEFTLRAVINGKMDLLQAEAVRDFIDAQTDTQARTAMRQMSGSVSRRLSPVKQQLIKLIAHLEAGIDFAEDDVELPDSTKIANEVRDVKDTLEALQRTYSYGRLLKLGIRIVIVGKPNVGKSSLFNCLVNSDRAIVTDIPGTTRDIISEGTSLDGIPLNIFDTAGVREALDRVEQIGVSRALETAAEADLILFVVDGSATFEQEDQNVWERVRQLPHLVVANKADLAQAHDPELEKMRPIRLSARTGEGLDELRRTIRNSLGEIPSEDLAESILTTARQHEAVVRAITQLEGGEAALNEGVPHEMVLLDLYQALVSLNELTGETTTEDILGQIFSTFCIGK
jgi:tRNA modification GTPase